MRDLIRPEIINEMTLKKLSEPFLRFLDKVGFNQDLFKKELLF